MPSRQADHRCYSHTSTCLHLQRQLAGERIAALLEDRRIREYEEAAHRAYMDQQCGIQKYCSVPQNHRSCANMSVSSNTRWYAGRPG
eukprot:525839-Pelagomonas_calceolata.AAC.4